MKGPILCFYGPPGVGRTRSAGKSIAGRWAGNYSNLPAEFATKLKFAGTGALMWERLPGRIIQSIRKQAPQNPVFYGSMRLTSWGWMVQREPLSALLEVLDPAE